MKIKCCECGKMAVWFYMPSRDAEKDSYCDDCVPRGCSCNMSPIDGNWDSEDDNNWIDDTDDLGRQLPCCEYGHYPEGIDNEIDDIESINAKFDEVAEIIEYEDFH